MKDSAELDDASKACQFEVKLDAAFTAFVRMNLSHCLRT
jgi:hypothetical protein